MIFQKSGKSWAWFSDDRTASLNSSIGTTARFSIGEDGRKPIICFGINPSIATPYKYDPTIDSMIRIATNASNRYDGFIMFNIYPQIATDPNELHNPFSPELKAENEKHIAEILKKLSESNQKLTLWAAWGKIIKMRTYLSRIKEDILNLPEVQCCQWVTLDRTKYPAERHPLYVKNDTVLVPYKP